MSGSGVRFSMTMLGAWLLAGCGGRSASPDGPVDGAVTHPGDAPSAAAAGSGGVGGPVSPDAPPEPSPPAPMGGTCGDGVLDGDEADVDCGGAACGVCSSGASCRVDFDCEGRHCLNAVCQQATCADGVHNGDELDVDCGGSCGRCPVRLEPCDCPSSERLQPLACGGIDLWRSFSSADGETLVYAQNAYTYAWTAATGPVLRHENADVIGLSADGQTLLLEVHPSGATELWKPDQPALALPGGSPLGFSADGRAVLFFDESTKTSALWRDGLSLDVGARQGDWFVFARALSADGSAVVGTHYRNDEIAPYQLPFRWTEAQGLTIVEPLPPTANHGTAVVTSRDGSVVAGWVWAGSDDSVSSIFRWTAELGAVEIAPGGIGAGGALVAPLLSDDGAVVVGTLGAGNGREITRSFRWSEAEGLSLLGGETAPPSVASLVSADARIIVGYLLPDADTLSLFVWTANRGLRTLPAALADAGADVGNWTFESASALSADGRVLYGMGRCGSQRAAYRAVLPE